MIGHHERERGEADDWDQDPQDLLGRVGGRREVVRGEDGQRGRLAQPFVLEPVVVRAGGPSSRFFKRSQARPAARRAAGRRRPGRSGLGRHRAVVSVIGLRSDAPRPVKDPSRTAARSVKNAQRSPAMADRFRPSRSRPRGWARPWASGWAVAVARRPRSPSGTTSARTSPAAACSCWRWWRRAWSAGARAAVGTAVVAAAALQPGRSCRPYGALKVDAWRGLGGPRRLPGRGPGGGRRWWRPRRDRRRAAEAAGGRGARALRAAAGADEERVRLREEVARLRGARAGGRAAVGAAALGVARPAHARWPPSGPWPPTCGTGSVYDEPTRIELLRHGVRRGRAPRPHRRQPALA